jgi:hypothetical protein
MAPKASTRAADLPQARPAPVTTAAGNAATAAQKRRWLRDMRWAVQASQAGSQERALEVEVRSNGVFLLGWPHATSTLSDHAFFRDVVLFLALKSMIVSVGGSVIDISQQGEHEFLECLMCGAQPG